MGSTINLKRDIATALRRASKEQESAAKWSDAARRCMSYVGPARDFAAASAESAISWQRIAAVSYRSARREFDTAERLTRELRAAESYVLRDMDGRFYFIRPDRTVSGPLTRQAAIQRAWAITVRASSNGESL